MGISSSEYASESEETYFEREDLCLRGGGEARRSCLCLYLARLDSSSELEDEDKWQLIFDHPENSFLEDRSPTAVLPIGVELAIPLIEEE